MQYIKKKGQNMENKFREFTDLLAWQESHKLVLEIYKQTQTLPNSEKYNLTSQLQRASVSITCNIAEGFSRQSYKEKINFMFVAFGSAKEVQNPLLICRDLGYVDASIYQQLNNQSNKVNQLLFGLIKSLHSRVSAPNTSL